MYFHFPSFFIGTVRCSIPHHSTQRTNRPIHLYLRWYFFLLLHILWALGNYVFCNTNSSIQKHARYQWSWMSECIFDENQIFPLTCFSSGTSYFASPHSCLFMISGKCGFLAMLVRARSNKSQIYLKMHAFRFLIDINLVIIDIAILFPLMIILWLGSIKRGQVVRCHAKS